MNEAKLEAFKEHLLEIRPIMENFCNLNNFTFIDRKSLGRYPRARIERPSLVRCWFDLWMQLDADGRRFCEFSRNIPYELSAGAYVDVQDGSKYGSRFQKALSCFSGVPFERVAGILENEMQKYLPIIEGWDIQYLEDNGEKVQLGS